MWLTWKSNAREGIQNDSPNVALKIELFLLLWSDRLRVWCKVSLTWKTKYFTHSSGIKNVKNYQQGPNLFKPIEQLVCCLFIPCWWSNYRVRIADGLREGLSSRFDDSQRVWDGIGNDGCAEPNESVATVTANLCRWNWNSFLKSNKERFLLR